TLAAAWRPRRTRRHRTCRPCRTRADGGQGTCRVLPRGDSDATVEDLALDLLDRLRDGDAAGARLGAVVGRAAAPHAVEVVHHRQALGGALVARVEDEAVRVDDGGGPDVAPVRPEHGAGRGAGGAQDALRRGVEELAVLGALEPFGGGRRLLVDEVRQHRLVGVEERLHVDDQVLEDREAGERLYGDPRAQVLHQHLAGQAVAAVDQHRVRAADAVGARAPERQAAGTLPLDVVEDVEDPLVRVDVQLVLLPAGLLVDLGVEALDPDGDLHDAPWGVPCPCRGPLARGVAATVTVLVDAGHRLVAAEGHG